MTPNRQVLTPDALSMMDVIARTGSFAAAARELGKVPSSLTYSVRQLEEALDVLLFDRRSRQARLTAAGCELLDEGRRLLEQMDAVANRVRRVATGWESRLSIAADDVISRVTLLELCDAFYQLRAPAGAAATVAPDRGLADGPTARASGGGAPGTTSGTVVPGRSGPGTRLQLRTEVMTGTWEALTSGQADLAIGVGMDRNTPAGVRIEALGRMPFVFALAPHHPLATAAEPLADAELLIHRAVAVADTALRLPALTLNLLPGQDVLTVSTMQLKIDALVHGIGCGFVPEHAVREQLDAGRLVARAVQREPMQPHFGYAWRVPLAGQPGSPRRPQLGLALRWWLEQLERPATRTALLERRG